MISVIIPTRNRADLLTPAIQSLLTQTLDRDHFETLVIDNGSTDHTAEVVRGFSNQLPNLRYIHAPKLGLHVGRHEGMREAKGDVLVFADDDIEATSTWLESYHQVFADPQVAMAGGNNFPLFIQPPPDWLKSLWEQRMRCGGRALPALSVLDLTGESREFSPYMVWGCNFAIRKSVLLEAGGFHPDGMPKELIRFRGDGESHVSRHIVDSGLKCMYHPAASVHHKVTPERMTHTYFRQRGYNQGVSDSYTSLRNLDASAPVSRRHLLWRGSSWVWRKLKEWVYLPLGARQAVNEFKQGHREGYAFHQHCYAIDPEVRAWVHKPNYL
ncbi:MAG: glycosyltransferase family 2 protein [Clostridia bacterium]|nr:glycosyltransferase family 2 protein [Clostridia bacterium]